MLGHANIHQNSGTLHVRSAHLTSDATFQLRNSLSQRTMKYPEKLYEAMDAGIFNQNDWLLTDVAAFGTSIFLRSRFGGRKFCLCYHHEAMNCTTFVAFDTIRMNFRDYQNQTSTPLQFRFDITE